MTKKPKPKRKPAKRGPKEEVLRIEGDPAIALAKLPDPDQVRDAKRRFDEAHRKGMRAMKTGDYDTFSDAIAEEKKIIDALPWAPDAIKPKR